MGKIEGIYRKIIYEMRNLTKGEIIGGSLTVALELGSGESVKLHQNSRITEIAALWGGFFSGGA